jgi:hypothetical protein
MDVNMVGPESRALLESGYNALKEAKPSDTREYSGIPEEVAGADW